MALPTCTAPRDRELEAETSVRNVDGERLSAVTAPSF